MENHQKFRNDCFIAENATIVGEVKWEINAVFGLMLLFVEMYIL